MTKNKTLIAARKAKGVSQAQAAREIPVSRSYLGQMENHGQVPEAMIADRVNAYYGTMIFRPDEADGAESTTAAPDDAAGQPRPSRRMGKRR